MNESRTPVHVSGEMREAVISDVECALFGTSDGEYVHDARELPVGEPLREATSPRFGIAADVQLLATQRDDARAERDRYREALDQLRDPLDSWYSRVAIADADYSHGSPDDRQWESHLAALSAARALVTHLEQVLDVRREATP